jgi:hypothetical protein
VRAAVLALAVPLLLVACGPDGDTACPAIGWLNVIRVELAGQWAEPATSVAVECSSPCGADGGDEATAPVTGAAAEVLIGMSAPESAVVTVSAADGRRLAEVRPELDWVRVGGSAECGGPMEATIAVP